MTDPRPDDVRSDKAFDRDWLAVAAAGLGLMFSVGALTGYPFGAFMGPISREFGWTRGQVSGALSFAQLSLVASSILWGVLLDKFGPRRILPISIVGLGVGLACLSRLTAPLWHLYFLFVLVPLLGAAANPLGYSGVLVRRFQKRLGLALGLALIGVGLGAAVLPALAQHFIAKFGWRNAYLALGGLAIAIGLPAAFIATRKAAAIIGRVPSPERVALLPFIRTKAFALICCTSFLVGMAGTGVLTHLISMMTDQGFTASFAAKLTGLVGISTILSRGVVGTLLDRVRAAYMVATVAAVCAVMCLLLAHGGGPAVFGVACVLLGLVAGAEVDFISFLVRRYFGAAAFGRLFAIAFAAFVLGPGAVVSGYSFDHFHTYRPALLLFAGASALASLLALGLPRYTPLPVAATVPVR